MGLLRWGFFVSTAHAYQYLTTHCWKPRNKSNRNTAKVTLCL